MNNDNKIRWSVTPAKAAKDTKISDTAFRTLAILGIYTDENGICYPALSTIAKIREISRQAIHKHILELEAGGYLSRKARYSKGARQSNILQVKFDFDPEGCQPQKLTPCKPQKLTGVSTSEVSQNDKNLTTPINDNIARPQKSRSEKQKSNDTIHEAISQVTKCLSGSFNGKVTAGLREANPGKDSEWIVSEIFRRFGPNSLWYKNDFRGKKGQPPTPGQIYQEWDRIMVETISSSKERATIDDLRAAGYPG